MDWQMMIPGGEDVPREAWENAWEIRLRPGRPLALCRGGEVTWGLRALTREEVDRAAQALSRHGLAARGRELRAGYLPLPGGHRLGVCGVMGPEGLREITSLCLRLAREVRDAGEKVYPRIKGQGTLIVGPPGAGKTTLLRDLIRRYALDGWPVGVADERGEIAACREGTPQLDVGPMTDVVTGMEKGRALMLLIRAMAPRVAAADEIGGEEDAEALLEAAKCGVSVLCTAHGESVEQVRERAGIGALLRSGAVTRAVTLRGPGRQPQVRALNGEDGA